MLNRAIDDAAAFTDMLKKLEEVPQRQLGQSPQHRAAEMAVAGYETRTQRRARERREAKEAIRQAKQEAK